MALGTAVWVDVRVGVTLAVWVGVAGAMVWVGVAVVVENLVGVALGRAPAVSPVAGGGVTVFGAAQPAANKVKTKTANSRRQRFL